MIKIVDKIYVLNVQKSELPSESVKFPQSDGHTEKLEIRKEGLGGVQWKIKENDEHLTKNSRKK